MTQTLTSTFWNLCPIFFKLDYSKIFSQNFNINMILVFLVDISSNWIISKHYVVCIEYATQYNGFMVVSLLHVQSSLDYLLPLELVKMLVDSAGVGYKIYI